MQKGANLLRLSPFYLLAVSKSALIKSTITKQIDYKQRLGLGKPAYLVACFAGPSGNSLKR
jgi:hypothetical protein